MASTAPRRVLDMFSYGGVHYDRVLLARLHELQDIVHMHVMIEMGAPLSLNVNYVHQHTVSQRWNSKRAMLAPLASPHHARAAGWSRALFAS